MERAFIEIIDSISKSLEEKIKCTREGENIVFSVPENLGISGRTDVEFYLDNNGKAHYEFSKFIPFGRPVHIVAWITDPPATYDIMVRSNYGGGGSWHGVKVGTHLEFTLNSNAFHDMVVTIDISSSVKNTKGHIHIEYNV